MRKKNYVHFWDTARGDWLAPLIREFKVNSYTFITRVYNRATQRDVKSNTNVFNLKPDIE